MTRKPLLHLVFSLIFLAAVIGIYAAWYGKVEGLSAEATELRSQVVNRNQQSASTLRVQNELEALATEETSIYHYFVSPTDIVPFLETLQAIGRGDGAVVDVTSVSADNEKPQGHLKLLVTVTGPFNAVEKTLGSIEYQAYDTRLTNLILDTQPGSGIWHAQATILVGTTPQVSGGATKKP